MSHTAGQSKLFLLHLKHSEFSDLSIYKINQIIDSLNQLSIKPFENKSGPSETLNSYDYKNVLDTIMIETAVQIDSVERKKLFARLGKAIKGKTEVQKEKTEVTFTIKKGASSLQGSLEEHLDYILNNANTYYQKEFAGYKKQLSTIKDKEKDFYRSNAKLLNYSNSLLNQYNEALSAFSKEARCNFQEQYKATKLIRSYTTIGIVVLMMVVSIALIHLTRIAFAYEKQLIEAQSEIQENLNFKNRMISMISHDIRSPLHTVSIFIKGLKKKALQPEIESSLKAIEMTTSSMLLLANQILDFSKNKTVPFRLSPMHFNLRTELDAITHELESFVATNGNLLVVRNHVAEEREVYTDLVKMYQLFYNLVGNANKFTQNGTIQVHIHCEEATAHSLKLEVEISDDGVGIEENDLAHIFDHYYQANSLRHVQNIGIGLGLNLCKEIVELFDGAITIDSEVNKGTTVRFYCYLKKENL